MGFHLLQTWQQQACVGKWIFLTRSSSSVKEVKCPENLNMLLPTFATFQPILYPLKEGKPAPHVSDQLCSDRS